VLSKPLESPVCHCSRIYKDKTRCAEFATMFIAGSVALGVVALVAISVFFYRRQGKVMVHALSQVNELKSENEEHVANKPFESDRNHL
jgi:hypothetical protein